MEATLKGYIGKALTALGIHDIPVLLEHPADMRHGDWATNVAMAGAKAAGKNPRVLAEEIVGQLEAIADENIFKIEIAGPGFINIHLSDTYFTKALTAALATGEQFGVNDTLKGKKVIVEYTDPNPFKEFHIGHLMSNTIGESIARIIEATGAETKRACYQGDVGLHVAKAIWGIIQKEEQSSGVFMFNPESEFTLGAAYAAGAQAYEKDEHAKKEIIEINKKLYRIISNKVTEDSKEGRWYKDGKAKSLQDFETMYQRLGTKFNYYFFESNTGLYSLGYIPPRVFFGSSTVPSTAVINPENSPKNWVLWQHTITVTDRDFLLRSLSFTQTESKYTGGITNVSLYIDGKEYKSFPGEYNGEEVVFDFSASPILLSTGSRVIGLTGDISAGFNSVFSFKLTTLLAQDKEKSLMLSLDDTNGDKSLQSGLQFSSEFYESEGAIVYKGDESKGLHTRVFVNKEGLPTYEAKELGLAKIKYDTYPYDVSIIITGNEVNDYFKVLLDAMAKVFPELAAKTEHYSHGMLRLSTGKMSSRTGDVITAESLIEETKIKALAKIVESEFSDTEKGAIAEQVAIGAIKYSILRQASGKDIIFDFEQSLSFEGDSGPYLQYTHARTRSLLAKAEGKPVDASRMEGSAAGTLHKFLLRFPEVVLRAQGEREPHYIATYLIEVAREFNSFYGNTIVLDGAPDEPYKLALVQTTADILKKGLWLLGIPTPIKM